MCGISYTLVDILVIGVGRVGIVDFRYLLLCVRCFALPCKDSVYVGSHVGRTGGDV